MLKTGLSFEETHLLIMSNGNKRITVFSGVCCLLGNDIQEEVWLYSVFLFQVFISRLPKRNDSS